ncbi:MAG TPA: hypothetical protein VGI81_25720 [Tepidisphaeraceae bacterium]|jgi:hypothetical protein
MADYHEIPETIRAFLATAGHPWGEDLTDVAQAYARLCREANERLRRCADYLRRGMRSEAVHLAECQPKLLPMVDALRLPDFAAWAKACVAHGLVPPPELLTDSLPQLEAAAEIEDRLRPLAERYRVLSLAKAPLRDRMEVLFPLHEKDPGNPVWVENLRTLGGARFKELRAQAQAAYKSRDLPALEGMAAEIQAQVAHMEVPDDLRRGVERAVGLVRLDHAKEELRPLLVQLQAARKANDYEQASAVLQQWQSIIESRQIALPTALQENIRPIIAWVAGEERRRSQDQKMQRMRPALNDTERLFRAARRRQILVASLVVLAVLIVAGVLVLIYAPYLGRR